MHGKFATCRVTKLPKFSRHVANFRVKLYPDEYTKSRHECRH